MTEWLDGAGQSCCGLCVAHASPSKTAAKAATSNVWRMGRTPVPPPAGQRHVTRIVPYAPRFRSHLRPSRRSALSGLSRRPRCSGRRGDRIGRFLLRCMSTLDPLVEPAPVTERQRGRRTRPQAKARRRYQGGAQARRPDHRVQARSPIARRTFHFRPYGAPSAVHRHRTGCRC
jgi:hypothetical protein